MFCKNCGKEIKDGVKFCPECGTMISNPVKQKKKKTKESKNSNNSKNSKKSKKWIAPVAAVVVLAILGVGIIPRLTKSNQTVFDKKDYGFDKSIYKDNNYSNKQIKQLKKAYEEARADEEKSWPLLLELHKEYISNYEDVKSEYDSLIGGTEAVYQMLNDFDPNLKKVAAKDVAYKVADGPMSYYLTEKGVATVLADNDLGKDLRAAGENILLGLMEYMTISQMESNAKITVRSDQMVSVDASNEYALIRSYGMISSMLDQMEILNGDYKMALETIEEREAIIMEQSGSSKLFGDTAEEDFEINLERSGLYARNDFLEQKKTELQEGMYLAEADLLKIVGIEGTEEILNERFGMTDTNEDANEEANEDAGKIVSKYVYSIIDKDGKVYCSFLVANPDLQATINDEGIASVSAGGIFLNSDVDSNRIGHVIINKDGKVLYEDGTKGDESDKIYSDISSDGNALEKTFGSNSTQGDYETLNFVTPDGTSKTLLEGGIITLDAEEGNDYYSYRCEFRSSQEKDETGVIDMTTGELITSEEYREIQDENEDSESFYCNFNNVSDIDPEHRLNKDYVMKNDVIYDNDNNEIKEFSEGSGVEEISYENGKYWIITKSGYYYSMDKNFEKLTELKELPKDKKYILSDYGIITIEDFEVEESNDKNDIYDIDKLFSESQSVYYACLYDEENQQLQMIQSSDIPEVDHFLTISKNFVQSPLSGAYNMNTKELIFISMPEKPISLVLE